MKWFKPKNMTDSPFIWHKSIELPPSSASFQGIRRESFTKPGGPVVQPEIQCATTCGMVWIWFEYGLNRAVDELLMFFVVYFFTY